MYQEDQEINDAYTDEETNAIRKEKPAKCYKRFVIPDANANEEGE